MDFKKLVEAGRKAQTAAVSDSVIRRKRILDAKRRMAARREERDEDAPRVNRIGDSARPTRTPMRGIAAERVSAMQGLRRKQDSAAKSFYALRKRIKDELAETETKEEAIETAVAIMEENVEVAPQDVLAAVVDVISEVIDTLPEGNGDAAEESYDEDGGDYEDEGEEVADSRMPRSIVRRRTADSARRAEIRRRVLDAMKRRDAAARRVRDARIRRAGVARRSVVSDAAMQRRTAARRAMARRADSVEKRIVRRK